MIKVGAGGLEVFFTIDSPRLWMEFILLYFLGPIVGWAMEGEKILFGWGRNVGDTAHCTLTFWERKEQ